MKKLLKFIIFFVLGLVLFGVVIGALTDNDSDSTPAKSSNETAAINETSAAETTQNNTAENSDSMTAQQKNAVRSAKQYLSFKGFSRDGLIEQLSSEYGDGYDVQDATVAVDSLDVDWNEQAVKAAQAYLEFKGFSCKGLVQQLSSSAGDKFTKEQAEYGAKAAGTCN